MQKTRTKKRRIRPTTITGYLDCVRAVHIRTETENASGISHIRHEDTFGGTRRLDSGDICRLNVE